MKKTLSLLLLFSLLEMWLLPSAVLAVTAPESCKLAADLTDIDPTCTKGAEVSIEKFGLCCALSAVYTVTNYLTIILFALVMIFVILGAFNIMMAGGDPAKVTTGQNYIVYAAAGLAVALLAKAIPGLVKLIIGVK